MHPPAIRSEALRLIATGVNDCEISRRLGVPRSTVRDWRRPSYVAQPRPICPRCWRPGRATAFSPSDYCELLGLYLGDGHITALSRTYRLRLSLDSKYPDLNAGILSLLERCFIRQCVASVVLDGGSTTVLNLYCNHLPCLFPQHGRGKKHHRPIELEPWQRALVESAPGSLLRGLINADGCCFVNRTGRYEYVSYAFSNRSRDILDLFVWACGLLGVACRRYEQMVRINRRESVARLLPHVGPKS